MGRNKPHVGHDGRHSRRSPTDVHSAVEVVAARAATLASRARSGGWGGGEAWGTSDTKKKSDGLLVVPPPECYLDRPLHIDVIDPRVLGTLDRPRSDSRLGRHPLPPRPRAVTPFENRDVRVADHC
jgi:hypothetical protein